MRLSLEEKAKRVEERKVKREAEKELKRIETEKNQPEISEITFTIEWKKSRTWGYCPRLEVNGYYKESIPGEGKFFRDDSFYASGCGYDKLSTVVGQACNKYLKYLLWKNETRIKAEKNNPDFPYGISNYSENRFSYGQGIGIECYPRIFEYLGAKFEKIASGSSFDVYKVTL